ncbi:MAG: RNA polymerase sigma factor [Actinomycetota bacterium]
MSPSDAEVYEKYADELVRFATGLVGPTDAADVVADTFAKAVDSVRWERVSDPRSYLYQAVLNQVRMRHRSTMRRRARELRTAPREGIDPPEVRPEVLEAVGRLSSRQRAVIVLTYWEDLAAREVADSLGLSEGTVKRHLARGRARLREMLGG